jgi:hypothetical protein
MINISCSNWISQARIFVFVLNDTVLVLMIMSWPLSWSCTYCLGFASQDQDHGTGLPLARKNSLTFPTNLQLQMKKPLAPIKTSI